MRSHEMSWARRGRTCGSVGACSVVAGRIVSQGGWQCVCLQCCCWSDCVAGWLAVQCTLGRGLALSASGAALALSLACWLLRVELPSPPRRSVRAPRPPPGGGSACKCTAGGGEVWSPPPAFQRAPPPRPRRVRGTASGAPLVLGACSAARLAGFDYWLGRRGTARGARSGVSRIPPSLAFPFPAPRPRRRSPAPPLAALALSASPLGCGSLLAVFFI